MICGAAAAWFCVAALVPHGILRDLEVTQNQDPGAGS